jgi:hypothetical protein
MSEKTTVMAGRLPRWVLDGFVAFLALIASALPPVGARQATAGNPAALVFEAPEHAFSGRVVEGDLLEHTYEVKNTGSQPVGITGVRTTCGCVRADYERTIPPGEIGHVTLTFHTKGYRGDLTHKALVSTTEAVRPRHMLHLRATVIPAVEALPDRVFLEGFPEDALSQEVAIVSRTGRPLSLSLDETHTRIPRGVTYRLQKEKEGRYYRLILSNKESEPRTYRGRLVFDTGSDVRPKLVVPIFGRVKPDIEVVPKALDFGVLSRQKLLKPSRRAGVVPPELIQTVHVRSNRDEDLTVDGVEVDEEVFAVTVTPVLKHRVYRVALTCRPTSIPAGTLTTEMVIHTGVTGYEKLRVPVRVIMR